MPMTLVVTRNAAERTRGFLGSCMLEVAPGVYTAPRLSAAVRRRVWEVLSDWFEPNMDAATVMTWPDETEPGGQAFLTLGAPRTELFEHDGVYLGRRGLNTQEVESLDPNSSVVWARAMLLRDDVLVVDTETTGLEADDEIVSLAAFRPDGKSVMSLQCRPTKPVSAEARGVHGLGAKELASSPRFAELHGALRELLGGQLLIAYNAEFDARLLGQTCSRYGVEPIEAHWDCLMRRYETWREIHCSLAVACELERLATAGRHTATGDAIAAVSLLRRMAGAPGLGHSFEN